MRDRIKQLLQEFKIDELSRVEYKDGEIVMEYIEGYEYPRYVFILRLTSNDKYRWTQR